MDIFDPQKRSQIMSRVRGMNTKPELRVRSYLHKAGLRYVLHDKRLPGRPDLSFPTRKVAVFVHGCFWHGHEGCKRATVPSTRADFWRAKLRANKERDMRNLEALEGLGWKVLIVWQCSINEKRLADLVREIASMPRRGRNNEKH